MVKNREPKKPVEPESKPEEKEEQGSDGESTEEAAESEPENPVQSVPDEGHSPEDDPDSESGSDSDGPEKIAKPESAKLGSKKDSDPAPPPKPAALKRPPGGDGKDPKAKGSSKRTKANPKPEAGASEKKQNRLWSEEDEVVILKGLVDYAAKKKADPTADVHAFHEFIRKKIHIDATRAQVHDKIRKLKSKYSNNKNKETDGKKVTFAKPHEEEVYDLSKKIWGEEAKVAGNGGSSASARKVAANKKTAGAEDGKNENTRKVVAKEVKAEKHKDENMQKAEEVVKGANAPRTVEERVMSIGAEVFEGGGDVEGAEEWRGLKVREIEVLLTQLEVKSAQVKMVLDHLRSH